MIVYQLEPKSKFRLMCEGGYLNITEKMWQLTIHLATLFL
jgi:hypothetical protein